MVKQGLPQRQIPSEKFVESCGAILFDLSDPKNKKVCLVRGREGDWLLAKGRRDQGESRKDAALREVMEETGHRCRLFPVRMSTRAPPPNSEADWIDKPREYDDLIEPFWCTIRELNKKNGKGTKIIWWYIAVLEKNEEAERLPGEDKFVPRFFSCHDALKIISFQGDRQLLSRAIELVNATLTRNMISSEEGEQSKADTAMANADGLKEGANEERQDRKSLIQSPRASQRSKKKRRLQKGLSTEVTLSRRQRKIIARAQQAQEQIPKL